MPKGAAAVGIELDSRSIRGAKIGPGKTVKAGGSLIAALEELSGPFAGDEAIVDGLRRLRQKMAISFADTVVTCVGGKQTYAAQLSFRKLPDEELKTALKFEIRKNLSFDTAGSVVEYQFLSAPKKNEPAPVIVTSVVNALLQRQLRLFEKAGLPPTIIDVFPLTVANAFRTGRAGAESPERGAVILHIGPDFSTVVIEGDGSDIPFYNRTIYFSAAEIFDGGAGEPLASPREIELRINAFTAEISRSLAYYQSAYRAATDSSLTVLGGYALPELLEKVGHDTGLAVTRLDLVNEFDARQTAPPGRFDVAVTLGMRGREL
ncbi:MAG: pilus assembly protein PilM [Chitinispirillaceae bacterium]|nr:pilus assembly protein PilM [Chitinispirillaceae bacterium]